MFGKPLLSGNLNPDVPLSPEVLLDSVLKGRPVPKAIADETTPEGTASNELGAAEGAAENELGAPEGISGRAEATAERPTRAAESVLPYMVKIIND